MPVKLLELLGENRVAPFQMDDSLPNASQRQLAPGDLNRQFLACFGPFASDTSDFFGAGTFTAQQFERSSNLCEFKIGGGGTDNHGVARAAEFELLALRAVLCGFQLSAERQVKNRLRVRQAEDGWSLAADS